MLSGHSVKAAWYIGIGIWNKRRDSIAISGYHHRCSISLPARREQRAAGATESLIETVRNWVAKPRLPRGGLTESSIRAAVQPPADLPACSGADMSAVSAQSPTAPPARSGRMEPEPS